MSSNNLIYIVDICFKNILVMIHVPQGHVIGHILVSGYLLDTISSRNIILLEHNNVSHDDPIQLIMSLIISDSIWLCAYEVL